jgi:transcriptional regulator with XRE-family HTH domain
MPSDNCIEVGRRIKATRENQHMTQYALGRLFGVPFQMIQRWEHGEQLTIERMFSIAVALKVDAIWLISGQYGVEPHLCRALSETSMQLGRVQSATELMDTMKLRDRLRRQIDPLLGVEPLPVTLAHLLKGLLPTLTLV